MGEGREEIVDVLRRRVLRGLHAGTLELGERLPSARELERDFDSDHRIILAAYRRLADEGLVEIRQRGGIYVSRAVAAGGPAPAPAEKWLADVLATGVARELSLGSVVEWFRRATETLRLRVVAIQSTPDQIEGLCRELREEYGLTCDGANVAELVSQIPAVVRRADLFVTTTAFAKPTQQLAQMLGKSCIVAHVRPDLIGGEWRMLLRRPVYVVVRDERFGALLTRFFTDRPGAENLRIMVLGRDNLRAIPREAPTYVTRSALAIVGDVGLIGGRILPPARLFSMQTSREIIEFIIQSNLRALSGIDAAHTE